MPSEVFDTEFYRKGAYGRGKPLLGLGEGDSALFFDVLGEDSSETIFKHLNEEVQWGRMFNSSKAVQRMVAIQGVIDESPKTKNRREPLYRHPADEQPPLLDFTPHVNNIRLAIERDIIKEQTLNHCLIQLYRSGSDQISEHADKTLDIEKESKILNYSAGATRVMTLRTKKAIPGTTNNYNIQKVTLPHNSVFILGWNTNRTWKHSIKPDKRLPSLKSQDELREGCQRISLTFRTVSTFIRHMDGRVYGQGGKYKTEEKLDTAIENGEQDSDMVTESVRMVKAFSVENHSNDFDWNEYYGEGFNIINFKTLLE